jgi:hypothetical protein
MLLVPVAFAEVTQFSVSPSSIPTNGTVTISICTTTHTIVQQVLVTTPDGLVWKLEGGDIALSPSYICPTTVNIIFGDNTPNWCVASLTPLARGAIAGNCLSPQPSATQTGVLGDYAAQVIYKSGQHGTEQFHVFQSFLVLPEYPLGALAAVVVPGVALLGYSKYRKKNQVQDTK